MEAIRDGGDSRLALMGFCVKCLDSTRSVYTMPLLSLLNVFTKQLSEFSAMFANRPKVDFGTQPLDR